MKIGWTKQFPSVNRGFIRRLTFTKLFNCFGHAHQALSLGNNPLRTTVFKANRTAEPLHMDLIGTLPNTNLWTKRCNRDIWKIVEPDSSKPDNVDDSYKKCSHSIWPLGNAVPNKYIFAKSLRSSARTKVFPTVCFLLIQKTLWTKLFRLNATARLTVTATHSRSNSFSCCRSISSPGTFTVSYLPTCSTKNDPSRRPAIISVKPLR